MVEFELDGRHFRFNKLSAMQQFHVSRKIAPLLPPLMPIFARVAEEQAKGAEIVDDLGAIGPLLQPFADGLASMSDEASEYVFNACLAAIQYRHMNNWVQFWSPAKVPMFTELNDMGLMLRLVVRVIQESLAPFINSLAMNAGVAAPASRSEDSPVEKNISLVR